MPLAPIADDGKRPTEFAPPRARHRPVPGPVDPPSENRDRMRYPYGEMFPGDAA